MEKYTKGEKAKMDQFPCLKLYMKSEKHVWTELDIKTARKKPWTSIFTHVNDQQIFDQWILCSQSTLTLPIEELTIPELSYQLFFIIFMWRT